MGPTVCGHRKQLLPQRYNINEPEMNPSVHSLLSDSNIYTLLGNIFESTMISGGHLLSKNNWLIKIIIKLLAWFTIVT